MGVLPVGLRRHCRWPADAISGADFRGPGEAQQPLGHCAQSHFAHPKASASRSCWPTFRTTGACKAAIALKLVVSPRELKEPSTGGPSALPSATSLQSAAAEDLLGCRSP